MSQRNITVSPSFWDELEESLQADERFCSAAGTGNELELLTLTGKKLIFLRRESEGKRKK